MAVCALISPAAGAGVFALAALAGQGFGAELRKAEFRKVQSFHTKIWTISAPLPLVTRLTNDITVLQNAVSNGIRPLVRSPVMLVTALSLSAVMSPRLALVFVAAPAGTGRLPVPYPAPAASPVRRHSQKALDKVNAVVQENLIAIRVVKSYVRGDYERGKFGEANEGYQSVAGAPSGWRR